MHPATLIRVNGAESITGNVPSALKALIYAVFGPLPQA